jgi:hypothetical protein
MVIIGMLKNKNGVKIRHNGINDGDDKKTQSNISC